MRTTTRALVALVAVALAIAPALLSADDKAAKEGTKVVRPAPAAEFTALNGVKKVQLTPAQMDAIKGQHVHFVTLSNEKLHLAGDIKTENNWSNEWGGTDGMPVAPSYHGLCTAHGNGSIFIPTRGAITTQCPAGS